MRFESSTLSSLISQGWVKHTATKVIFFIHIKHSSSPLFFQGTQILNVRTLPRKGLSRQRCLWWAEGRPWAPPSSLLLCGVYSTLQTKKENNAFGRCQQQRTWLLCLNKYKSLAWNEKWGPSISGICALKSKRWGSVSLLGDVGSLMKSTHIGPVMCSLSQPPLPNSLLKNTPPLPSLPTGQILVENKMSFWFNSGEG